MSEYYSSALTPREKEVYCKVVNNIKGLKQEELAQELGLSKSTFHTHLLNIYIKKGVSTQIELIVKHYRERINGNNITKRT